MDRFQKIEQKVQNLRSPKRSHTFWGFLGILLVCGTLLWLQHQSWLQQPNDYMLGGGPDGFKNYMTTAWHVRHDSNYVHYGGMNYPFGEHVLFTDNQPIFSAALQWWSWHVGDLAGRSVGLLNISLVLSMLLGCGILFLLFRKLHLPVWYAGLVALGMCFLAPQYNRIDGHFGLSHSFIIPLLLYLLCLYEERVSRRYQSILIGVLVWFAAQLHFYYFGMAALFLTLYTAYQILRDFSGKTLFGRMSHWVIMVIVPFTFLNGWVHWSDYVTDRPSNPYGFLVYIGHWEGVFLPYESFPLYQWIDKHVVSIRRINGEAIAYAGMVATLFTLWLLGSGFRMFGRTWKDAAYHRTHAHYLRGIFFASLVLLLFACGFPFALPGLEWMVDYMGPLRQFRGLGRFTWVYYYTANLLAFYALWNWRIRFNGFFGGKMLWLRHALPAFFLLLLAYEAILLQQKKQIEIVPNLARRELAAPAADHWLNNVDFGPYQALLPLPYYHMGSENIWLEYDFGHFKNVQTTALHTGVPDMGVNLSRTSARQTTESVQFVLEPGEMPTMLNELPDNRPLALLVNPAHWEDVRNRYPHLVQKAFSIYNHPELKILSLRPDSLRAYIHEHTASISAEMDRQGVYRFGPWYSTRNARDFHHFGFDTLSGSQRVFQGKGAYAGNMKDTCMVFDAPLPKGYYYISAWIYVNQDLGMNHELKIVENKLSGGQQVQVRHEAMRFHLKSIVDGWGLFDIPFEVLDPDANVRIFLHKENVNQAFFLDEVLIKPADITLYRREPNWVVRNNFWYRY